MEIVILKQAERELRDTSKEVLEDVYALFEDLASGVSLGLPISRPLGWTLIGELEAGFGEIFCHI